MSRPTPRRLSVRPGPRGVADVAEAMRHVLDGEPGVLALAPAMLADRPVDQHALALTAALRDDAPIDHSDAALVMATSGSTGEPQGVLLSAPAIAAAADRGVAALGEPGLWLVAVPVTGIGGVIAAVRSSRSGHEPLAVRSVGGAAPFTATGFTEDAQVALARAEASGVPAYVSLVPTQLRRLVQDGPSLDVLAAFGAVLVGGAALRPDDRAAAREHGVRLVETYGATETCGGVIYNGEPLADVGLRFRDPATGEESADGPGQLIISGPTLALGYRLRRDLTAAAFRADGFHSPDFGRRVPGGIEIESRLDQIVKVGGVKVSLSAVSNAICAHPRVIDAVTVAERDPEWGMIPVSYVVSETHVVNSAPLQEELRALVAARLGRASVPRRLEFVDDLTLGHTGKPTGPAPA